MANILIVDDEFQVRDILKRTLEKHGHNCTLAADASEARNFLNKQAFDLVLCDVTMPGESGVDLAKYIGSEFENTSVIMVTAVEDPEVASTVLDAGIYGYIIKPFSQNMILINVHNALCRQKLEITNRIYQQNLEQKVEERTTKLKETLDGVIQAMGLTIEFRDPYTAGHQRRVADIAVAISKEMGIPKNQFEWIRMAGKIHDLGKVSVPAEILSKPGKLNENEFAIIKTHPSIGYDIIANIEFPWPIAQVILQNHEKINGSGYPQGLSGEDILLEARILCVSDVLEAMASHRPYRPSLGIEKALNEISENKGVLYDSDVVSALFKISTPEIEKLLG
jgi:response regulator RpfG family c-di-GMP phosphodiesterase